MSGLRRYPKLREDLRNWSGEVFVGGTKCLVGVGSSRLGRGEWEKESFFSPWRRRREEETEMTRRKANLGDLEDDPTVEVFTTYWKQKENSKDEENIIHIVDQEEKEGGIQIQEEEESDEDWGDEVGAYSRRGGLGVR